MVIRKQKLLLSIGILSFLLSSCVSTFNPVKQGYTMRGKTIAVIAGLDNEPNLHVARSMSESLAKHTRFQVMSSKKVEQTLIGYPSNIQGPYKSAYFEIEADYAKSDRNKISALQKKLGVDYLYVIWSPSATSYGEKIHSLNVIAQMFESGNEVANGRFNAVAGSSTCCLSPAPQDQDKAKAVENATDYVAKEIGTKMGMLKQ